MIKSKKYELRKSPPFHAKDYPNETKEGNDGEMYISKKDKNGIYKWILKYKFKKTVEEYYAQFGYKPKYNVSFIKSKLDNLKEDLKKIGIFLYYMKWNKKSFNKSISPFHTEELIDESSKLLMKKEETYPNGKILFSDNLLFFASIKKEKENKKLFITFDINNKVKKEFNNIFISYFPNRTKGYIGINKSIIINL